MDLSKLFFLKSSSINTYDKIEEALVKSCYIRKYVEGRYYFLPLGTIVLNKTINLIRAHMEKLGALETTIPLFHSMELRNETDRKFEGNLFIKGLSDNNGINYNLAASPEEMYINLLRDYDINYNYLPVNFFQFGKKFRDEDHQRYLLRLKEFTMMDSYSFHVDANSFKNEYQKITELYNNLFAELGLNVVRVPSYNSLLNEGTAHEFIVDSEAGESEYLISEDKSYAIHKDLYQKGYGDRNDLVERKGIELGNTYDVGHAFTSKMKKSTYKDIEGNLKPFYMGAYSIGIERLIASVAEKSQDRYGLIWPRSVAPYKFHVILENQDANLVNIIESKLNNEDILFDDRYNLPMKDRINDAYLIGCPFIVEITNNNHPTDICTFINRKDLSQTKLRITDLAVK